ncbi:PQQ-binding-like beta-propeller repeat protein [Demequina sp. NBRC 110057]|uniref:outer membrane protein assembly factor BamB family protein n=1 Tax=Demequina sp. NBRC 110057 TaxID=1570346 RepID=UPI0009FBCDE7|nr:PQQ-binding-like beta-propeller repeat protein [Demequina sp. NBRC 110057]
MHGLVTTADGTPLAGISVSNGRDVVGTDADGRFTLDRVTPFVTLTRTDAWTTDSWWLPASDDEELRFTLEAHAPTLPYEFVHLTDTHMSLPRDPDDEGTFGMYKDGSMPWEIQGFLENIATHAPDAQAVFITGDLVDHGLEAEFEAYLGAIAPSPVPVHVIPGNHDHMNGKHGMFVSRNNYFTNEGDPALYERMVGPRWYSFDIPGAHVVAMDWHSHELGLDHEVQNAWLQADLARLTPGSPWILLFHDQPNGSLLDHAPWQPVAAFSGHWHTSRVVDVEGTLHVNSPTTFFASLDYTPPAFRRVTWDGARISMRTETLRVVDAPEALHDVTRATFATSHGTGEAAALAWRTAAKGAGHRQAVAVADGVVYAGSQVEDQPVGWVEAFDGASGATLWSTPVRSAVKTTPVVSGDVVVVTEVSGDVHGLDRASGEIRWTVGSSDPLRRFAWNGPAVADGVIYVGDQSDLRAIDASTGEVLWRRHDLSPHHNLVNHAAPLIVGDLLVMGFWPTPSYPIGLNRHTGESVWENPAAEGQTFDMAKMLMIIGTAAFDESADAVVMPSFASTICVDRATGTVRWASRHASTFSPATPLLTDAGYVITETGRGLRMIDPADGALRWELGIDGEAPFPMASYSKDPHPVVAPPTLVDGTLVLPCLDGTVRVISLEGRELGRVQLDTPLAAALVRCGDVLVGLGTDGAIVGLSVAALLAEASAMADAVAAS